MLLLGDAESGVYAPTSGLYLSSNAGPTHYNWRIQTQRTVNGGFEIARSQEVGGTSFLAPYFVLNPSGSVGIGTGFPAEMLQVMGKTRADDFCLNSDPTRCLSSAKSTKIKCTSAYRVGGNNNNPVRISPKGGAAFSSNSDPVATENDGVRPITNGLGGDDYLWGIQCVEGWEKTGCHAGNAPQAMVDVWPSFYSCLSDDEEWDSGAIISIICCKIQ